MPATSPSAVTQHVSVPVGGPPLLGADGSTVSEAPLVMFFIAASVASAVVTLGLAPSMDALVLSTASLWRASVALTSVLSVATAAVRFLGGWGSGVVCGGGLCLPRPSELSPFPQKNAPETSHAQRRAPRGRLRMVVRMEKREGALSTLKTAGRAADCMATAHALPRSQTQKSAPKRRAEQAIGAMAAGGGRGLKERGRATGRAVEC